MYNISDVTLEDRSVSTQNDQVITCAMTGLSQTATVTWQDPDGSDISDGSDYTVVQGSESGGAQDSLLTIKSTKLQSLGDTSTFTCVVVSGAYPDSGSVTKTMILTKLAFGR